MNDPASPLPMREGRFLSLAAHGFHHVRYSDWGDPNNPDIVVCVHGLTRNGRDFDRLAAALASRFRVICPDVVGRGRSDWLVAKQDYGYATYCADMAALLAHLGAEKVRWVGTSMGGLIGMMLAAQPNTPITRIVINDVGPLVPKAAIARLRAYVGNDPRFASFAELKTFVREIYAPFGDIGEEGWQALATSSAREVDGEWALAYDPDIAVSLRAGPLEDVVLWPVWDALRCPVLLLHGADSDILLPETCDEMLARHPRTRLLRLPGIGHAPLLMSADQIEPVRDFLLES